MEKQIRSFLKNYLPSLKEGIIVEIGANNGSDTAAMLALLKPPFKYYAFEPDSRHYKALASLTEKYPSLVVSGLAIGNTNAEVDFYYSGGPGETGRDSSSIKKPTGHLERWPKIKFNLGKTRMVTLDTFAFVYNVHRVDFIWADIQGAELEMIAGGMNTLSRTRYLYTECYMKPYLYLDQPSFQDIYSVLPGEWNVLFRTPTDVLLERKLDD